MLFGRVAGQAAQLRLLAEESYRLQYPARVFVARPGDPQCPARSHLFEPATMSRHIHSIRLSVGGQHT
jgi:hypothetical protein